MIWDKSKKAKKISKDKQQIVVVFFWKKYK